MKDSKSFDRETNRDAIAIDLLWLRPQEVGGTEFFIRNLLDGMRELPDRFHIVLFVTEDNADSFRDYLEDPRFDLLVGHVKAANIAHRILWENFHANRLMRKNGIRNCFVPAYCRPFLNGGVRYLSTVHDLHAYHFPQYHPLHERVYTSLSMESDKHFSRYIVTSSDFVKKELEEIYHIPPSKLTRIYVPIVVNAAALSDKMPAEGGAIADAAQAVSGPEMLTWKNRTDKDTGKLQVAGTTDAGADRWKKLSERYGLAKKQYYYCVSHMLPHKNFNTIIRVMHEVKARGLDLPHKLVISGARESATNPAIRLIHELGLEKDVILTDFIEEEDKILLMKNCRAYLYPSVFEGFGMTLVEAMVCGAPVITTKCTCIPEVTQNSAHYVDDPYDVEQWIALMKTTTGNGEFHLEAYAPKTIARQYLDVMYRTFGIQMS